MVICRTLAHRREIANTAGEDQRMDQEDGTVVPGACVRARTQQPTQACEPENAASENTLI